MPSYRTLVVCIIVLVSVVGLAQASDVPTGIGDVFTAKSYEYLDAIVNAVRFYLTDPSDYARHRLASMQLMMVWLLAQENHRQATAAVWTEADKFQLLVVAYSVAVADFARRGVENRDQARCEAALLLAADAQAFAMGVRSRVFVP